MRFIANLKPTVLSNTAFSVDNSNPSSYIRNSLRNSQSFSIALQVQKTLSISTRKLSLIFLYQWTLQRLIYISPTTGNKFAQGLDASDICPKHLNTSSGWPPLDETISLYAIDNFMAPWKLESLHLVSECEGWYGITDFEFHHIPTIAASEHMDVFLIAAKKALLVCISSTNDYDLRRHDYIDFMTTLAKFAQLQDLTLILGGPSANVTFGDPHIPEESSNNIGLST
ncbi:hypothetical protein BDZ97DRAFT_1913707 [Flammula alnicola]|nr:hypothetical protein BDZ97DRAFT_1913707 [Flammula alnicola]